MAIRFFYHEINVATILANEWQLGQSSDVVVVSIYDMDDNVMDVTNVLMTNETGGLFSYDWTPSEAHNYRIDYWNQTLNSHDFEIVNVRTFSVSSSGSGGNTTLSALRNRFLKLIDNFNANDLTGTNSSGEMADLCINDGLQLIYSRLKASRYLQSYASTALISTASQSYIALSGISDIDEVASLKDLTNDVTLIGITAERYFREVPDPSTSTGNPYRFCRIFDRIYLDPRPAAAITYTCEYLKTYPRLANDSDSPLLPTKFDDWILKEARVIWWMMEDPANIPPIIKVERDDAREIYEADALSNTHVTLQSASHFGRGHRGVSNPYNHV